jgi:hypothetical protein
MTEYIVTYTSMVIDADDEDEAISRAMDSSGGHWEAIEQKEAFRVVNNVTGAAASKEFEKIEHANSTCYALNLAAGPGGLYGVERRTPTGWERVLW